LNVAFDRSCGQHAIFWHAPAVIAIYNASDLVFVTYGNYLIRMSYSAASAADWKFTSHDHRGSQLRSDKPH